MLSGCCICGDYSIHCKRKNTLEKKLFKLYSECLMEKLLIFCYNIEDSIIASITTARK